MILISYSDLIMYTVPQKWMHVVAAIQFCTSTGFLKKNFQPSGFIFSISEVGDRRENGEWRDGAEEAATIEETTRCD